MAANHTLWRNNCVKWWLMCRYGSFVCPRAPQHALSHPAGSLRNPHIELIITSQPLPSSITHILKQVEQSIPALDADCGGRTVASAFKIASIFCVCVKEISTLARRHCSTVPRPVNRRHNCILPGWCSKHLHWQLVALDVHKTSFFLRFAPHFIKVESTFLFLLLTFDAGSSWHCHTQGDSELLRA